MPAETTKPSAVPAPPALPVRAVTLFSSGVAYTLHEGTLPAGEASIPLTFRTTQVSDILKSLVLLDEEGTVRPAVYPSRDPVSRTLQTFAVNVQENQSRADLLRSLRGAELRVQTFAGETLEGRIVGVETRTEWEQNRSTTIEMLTLLTNEGIVAVDLPRVRVIRLLDSRLDKELREALQTLASSSDDARRTLHLSFSGAKSRSVRVGYLTEAPLWKVSYRLVLASAPTNTGASAVTHVGSSAYLQGWAIVENTSDEDWTNVELSLVSGRPVSFVQDMYQPLYVPRPVVPPDVIASPFPQLHGGDLMAPVPSGPASAGGGGAAYGAAYELAEDISMFAAAAAAPAPRQRVAAKPMAQPIQAQASGGATGELFAYDVEIPLSLPRQQAAMIPIVSQGDVPIEKLSLYNPHSGAGDKRYPLNALRLTNNTALHLKGGPITLFDDNTYAGEARMEDVPPGDSRLLTYAVDLAVEGEWQQPSWQELQQATKLTIFNGLLHITRSRRQEGTYTLKSKSKSKETRLVYIEHPFRSNWDLVQPKPTERTAQWYRFAITLPAGATQTVTIAEEQPVQEVLSLMDDGMEKVAVFINESTVSVRIKNALRPIVEARRRIEEIEAIVSAREEAVSTLHQEQKRLRENLTAIEKDTPLHRRYITDLEKQENRLAALHEEIEKYKKDAEAEAARLRDYIGGLAVE